MANISVTVQDGNNITLVSTPTATQVITIDRGIAGPAGPAGVPGGSTTQVQYNLNSAFAGSPNFTFNGSNLVLQSASASDAFRITQTGAGNALVVEDSVNPDTTPFIIDNAGRVIVGYTTRFAPDVNAPTIFPQVSVFGVSATAQYSAFSYINAAANAPVVSLSKSRGATIGTNTIVAINDTIGIVKFTAADGTAFVPAASISAQVDGTPGLNDMPGRLVFSTTADGAATSTERMRIDSTGAITLSNGTANGVAYLNGSKVLTTGTALVFDGTNLGVGGTSPTNAGYTNLYLNNTSGAQLFLSVNGANSRVLYSNAASLNYYISDSSPHVWHVNASEQMRLTSTGLGIGTSSPARKLQVNSGEAVAARFTRGGGIVANNSVEWFDGTNGWYAGVSGSNFWGVAYNSSGAIDGAAIRLDSAGNLGLGVTPSAWSTNRKAIQIGGTVAALGLAAQYSEIAHNAISTVGGPQYATSNPAAIVDFNNASAGGFAWRTAPSGTAGAAITFTQAMTLDASGNLLVGATSSSSGITLERAGSATAELKLNQTGAGGRDYRIGSTGAGYGSAGQLIFYDATAAAERMRLDSAGNLGVGTTSPSAKLDIAGTLRIDTTSNIYGKADNTSFVSLYGGGAYNAGAGIGLGGTSQAVNPNTIVFTRGNYVETARFDAAGNLGLGVTPSAWNSSFKAIQVAGSNGIGAAYTGSSYTAGMYCNAYATGASTYASLGSAFGACWYNQFNGSHVWYSAPAASGALTFTQAMTLDASGRLLVGQTSSSIGASGSLQNTIPGSSNTANIYLSAGGGGDPASAGNVTPRIDFGASGLSSFGTTYFGATGGYNARSLVFYTGSDNAGTERMRLDSSGNLGLGVTPSAWSTTPRAFQIGTNASVFSFSNNLGIASNAYYNVSNTWAYQANGYATRYESSANAAGNHVWFTAPSGTAGAAITFTQAMTLDASGNLGIGTTAAGGGRLVVAASYSGTNTATPYTNILANLVNTDRTTNNLSTLIFHGLTSAGQQQGLSAIVTQTTSYTDDAFSANMLFYTSNVGTNAEKMRLDANGNLLVGTTSPAGSERFNVTGSVANNIARFVNNNAASYGPLIQYGSGIDPNGTGNEFIDCRANVSTLRFNVRSNGGITNYQANNVNLSDRREKINFAPAGEYLSKICAIPVQTFNYIDQNMEEDGGLTLGVIAQDVQAVAPELVAESNWGTRDEQKLRLSIYQTDLQYALMKCIQEQQALITTLTDRITALEAK